MLAFFISYLLVFYMIFLNLAFKMEIVVGKYKQSIALIDDEDYDLVSKYRWCRVTTKMNKVYAVTLDRPKISMHRLIMNCIGDKSIFIDHKNHNGLDNRRYNLRRATKAQNCKNRRSARNSSSKYLGVSKNKVTGYFTAQIGIGNKKVISLGRFTNELEAAKVYNEAAKIYHGEFANLNEV